MVARKRSPGTRSKGTQEVAHASRWDSSIHARWNAPMVSELAQRTAVVRPKQSDVCRTGYADFPDASVRYPDDTSEQAQREVELYHRELEAYNAELRMKQLELAEVKQHYFDLYHSAPIAYCCIDAQGRILEANLRSAELLEGTPQELKGEPLSRFMHDDATRRSFRLQRQRAFHRSGIQAFQLELKSRSGVGRPIWAVLDVALSNHDQALVGRFVFLDVDQISQPNGERQEPRLEPLPPHNPESLGKLAGAIAHDFNNLLTGIMANVDLLELERTDPVARSEHLNDIRALTERGARLTRQLLGFARRGKFQVALIDFDSMLESITDLFQRTHPGIVIRLLHSTGTRRLLADRAQIEQVLLNLLSNAGDAMAGRGELGVSLEEIDLSALDVEKHGVKPGPYFKLSVTDNGIGMTEEVRRRLFEPFFTTREPNCGHGLGLASVDGIVKNHDGFITVKSVRGKGSTFVLYLPSSARVQSPAPSSGQGTAAHTEGTLLLVDDEEQIARGWSRALCHLGYQVIAVRSGEEAIARVRNEPSRFALVLLDLTMPGMGGEKAFEEIHRIAPSVKILVWSGCGNEGVATQLMARGCSGFIQKPSTVAALSAKLRELLQPTERPGSFEETSNRNR